MQCAALLCAILFSLPRQIDIDFQMSNYDFIQRWGRESKWLFYYGLNYIMWNILSSFIWLQFHMGEDSFKACYTTVNDHFVFSFYFHTAYFTA